jgi:hypothetical protein
MTQCAARRDAIPAETKVRSSPLKRRTIARVGFAVAVAAASFGATAGDIWVRVASSPDVQVFVDTGSLTKDSRGFIHVWTKTRYASVQTDVGVDYTTDMTRFVLDCVDARYGITGGKFLDAAGNVIRQFSGPAGELQPIPVATKIDAVARTVCAADSDTRHGQ